MSGNNNMMTTLNLETWNGVIPVILPWAKPTISSIGAASAGVAVPFFLYIIAMFYLIVPMWIENFESDRKRNQQESADNTNNNNGLFGKALSDYPINPTANNNPYYTTNNNTEIGMMMGPSSFSGLDVENQSGVTAGGGAFSRVQDMLGMGDSNGGGGSNGFGMDMRSRAVNNAGILYASSAPRTLY